MHEPNVQDARRLSRSASFGPFELCLDTGELRKHGVRVRLQGKPFQILSALLEVPGSVVSREELRARLWSNDTYVDFESGLNTAVNRLRAALADSAERPVYIETLSRVGYRFIAPVSFPDYASTQPLEPARVQEDIEPSFLVPREALQPPPKRLRLPTNVGIALAIVACIGMAMAGAWLLFVNHPQANPAFHQLTFGGGEISGARFSVDGSQIFYSAALNGQPPHLYALKAKTGDTTDLGFPGLLFEAVSPTGELAFFTQKGDHRRLKVVNPSGKPDSNVPEDAIAVDWSRNGTEWLMVRHGNERLVESPPGRVLYSTNVWLDSMRASPDGSQVAFVRHPVPDDDAGDIVVLKPDSQPRVISANWASVCGLAWSPSGREVWFTAATKGVDRQLRAATLDGHVRQLSEVPGGIVLHDIGRSGEALIARDTAQVNMFRGKLDGDAVEDISWLDWPVARAITADGNSVLFDETGDAGGTQYSTFLYSQTGRSRTRLGSGRAFDLSADGRWALTQRARTPADLNLIDIRTGITTAVAARDFIYEWARFVRTDPLQIVVGGGFQGEDQGVFLQKLPDGKPVRISSQFLISGVVDPQGRFVTGASADGAISTIDVANGTVQLLPNPEHLMPVAFLNERELLVWRSEAGAITLSALDLDGGEVHPYARLTGESEFLPHPMQFLVSNDLGTYVWSGMKSISTLFSVHGWT